jgi:putative oxidoreductase
MKSLFKNYWEILPDLYWSQILIRLPLAIVFISSGVGKLPYHASGGTAFGLSALVWLLVIVSEIGSGIGLIVGGLCTLPRLRDIALLGELGDMLTRFSGIVMCCVITGVIWTVLKPESLWLFITTDYLHFSLWVGGLYFALRGNWAVRGARI